MNTYPTPLTAVASFCHNPPTLWSNESRTADLAYPVTVHELGRFHDELPTYLSLEDHASPPPLTIGRASLRAVMTAEALAASSTSPVARPWLEAAAPIDQAEYLVFFGKNAADRPVVPSRLPEQYGTLRAADEYVPSMPPGYTMTGVCEDTSSLTRLWGQTFGRSAEDCQALAAACNAQTQLPRAADRRLWFAGSLHHGRLIGATLAECSLLPSSVKPTKMVKAVEITAGAIDRQHRRSRLGPLLIRTLMDRVRADVQSERHVIFAKGNVYSGAPYALARAGLRPPRHLPAPGVLRGNSRVGDGKQPAEAYRSFLLCCA